MSTSVTIVDIQGAARSIDGLAIQSPLLRCDALAERARAVGLREIWLKCENLQPGGSFKIRGAAHALASLPPDQARRGVVTHSSGNFALALARAAARLGLDCTVIMPEGASEVKVRGVLRAGARLLRCAATQAAREAAAREVVEQRGAVLIHPSDDLHVIAGQGTVGLELALEAPWLEAVVVPVGGGGLAGGVAVVFSE